MNNQKSEVEVLKIFRTLPKTKKENILNILKEIIRKEANENEKNN